MSSTMYVYVGAYIKLPQLTKRVTRIVYACECDTFSPSISPKFCPNCGVQPTPKTIEEEEYVSLEDLGIDVDAFFVQEIEDMNYLLNNISNKRLGYQFARHDTDVEQIEITPELMAECVKNYEDAYSEIIPILKQHYKGVKVEFGALTYWY